MITQRKEKAQHPRRSGHAEEDSEEFSIHKTIWADIADAQEFYLAVPDSSPKSNNSLLTLMPHGGDTVCMERMAGNRVRS